MPNTIKYSTSGDTQSLKKGNFYIGVGDVPKGPSNTTGHWQGITPPTSGYTIYIDGGVGGVRIMAPDSDEKLVAYANGMNNNTNYVSNGGNFTNGSLTPFSNTYSSTGGVVQVTSIVNDRPYVGSPSINAMYMNYNGGGIMSTTGLLTTGVTYTFSFWAKIISGSSFSISWNNQNGSGDTNAWTSSATLTTGWRRYTQTFTLNTSKNNFYFYSRSADTSLVAIITEFQLMTGSTYGGPGLQNTTEALRWFSAVSQDEVCVNRDYESVTTDGLVLNIDAGYTPSYPRTGTTWYDVSYSGNNGTLINGPSYSSLNGGSILFDGVNDNMTFNSLVFNNTPYSIEIIGKFNSTPVSGTRKSSIFGNVNFASEFTNTVTYFTNIKSNSTDTYFNFNFSTAGSILTNGIYHWVFTLDSSKLVRMYFNGKSITSPDTQLTGFTDLVSTFTRFGTWNNTRFYDGNLYIGRFYNKSLSGTEVLRNYQSVLPRLLGENIVTDGLVSYYDAGYYTSYPTTGTTWYDVGGYGNSGTLTNGPTFNSDNGGSFVFDGIDDRVATNYSASSFTNTTQIVWYKWNGVNQLKVLTYFGNSGSNGFGFLINDGTNGPNVGNRVSVLYGGSLYNAINSGTLYAQLVSNQWTHLSITRDSTTTRLYQNGTFLGSTTTTPTLTSNYNFTYGAESVGAAGNVSIMSFYNRALSATEVLQNYNAQKSRYGL